MSTENIIIKQFNDKNVREYKTVLNSYSIPNEFETLLKQRLEYDKNIFLMFRESETNLFIVKSKNIKLIGYCIVENVNALPEDFKGNWNFIYNISDAILKENPIVISDFMISKRNRRIGYGRKLANYILNEMFYDKRISLWAVEDGVHFWDKFGFEYVETDKSAMIIKRDKCNA